MRIAIIAPLVTPIREPQLGGSQAFVADLAHGLSDHGHDVHVYAAADSAIPGVTVVDTGVRAELLAEVLYRVDRPWAADGDAAEAAFRTVFDAVRQAPYAVVHNHAFDPPAVRFATNLESPVVHTLHLPPDAAMATALKEACRSSNPPTVAAVSSSAAAGWRQLTRVDLVLSDGVPVDRIPWSTAGGSQLLFAGRFSAEKGVADAIAIARRAGMPIELYGEPYDPEYARQQVEPHRGDPQVAIHGALTRRELWNRMARSRAVLCPARWEEPFGMVAAEAQAAGTPVIAYRRGALSEIVLDGRTGFVVPADDVAAAAAAVGEVTAIGRADCRRHAEAHLSLEASITTHERLYRQLQHATATRRHG